MIEQESGRLLRLVDQMAMALKIDAGTLDLHRRPPGASNRCCCTPSTQVGDRAHGRPSTRRATSRPRSTPGGSPRRSPKVSTNALRFSPPDIARPGRAPGPTDDGVVVEIVDRGPGIAPEQREALFEKFSRWRPAGYEDGPATGLGLFICAGSRGRTVATRRSTTPRGRVRCSGSGVPVEERRVTTARTVSLLICDDHKILTDALATMVGLDDDLVLVAPAGAHGRRGDRPRRPSTCPTWC